MSSGVLGSPDIAGFEPAGEADQDATDTATEPTEPHGGAEARLAVIADLLADLPEAERREVIADLSPAERVTVARLLIDHGGQAGQT